LNKAVVNSSVIIALTNTGNLNKLKHVFKETFVARAVFNEIVVAGKGLAGSAELEEATRKGWVKVKTVKDAVLVSALLDPLGCGEAETIVLAIQEQADTVVLDDKAARRKAKAMKLNVFGTLRILRLLYDAKALTKKEFTESLVQLRETGFRISDEVIKKVTDSL
jgi:predicted nucleic acid-binding protein